jgi:uncharacterized protein (TIGR02217 family)
MSNSVFPDLPGMKITIKRTPIWKTVSQESVSGRVVTAAMMSYPLRQYSLAFEFLRAADGYAELEQIEGFFNAHRGAFDSWLFRDPEDRAVVDQVFGVGNGAQTAFPLVRARGGFLEPVQSVDGSPAIKVDGLPAATPGDYALSTTGVVVFNSPPANGDVLTWTGNYFWRCRFASDSVDFERFLYRLWQLSRVDFRTVKL